MNHLAWFDSVMSDLAVRVFCHSKFLFYGEFLKKTRVCIYSGHSEILGGDLKYLVDLLNHINQEQFELTLYTDCHPKFNDWLNPWLKVPIEFNFLSTFPQISSRSWVDKYSIHFLPKIYRILLYLWRLVTGFYLRSKVINLWIFFWIFKKNKYDVFWFNNGGYLGKEAGLVACILAKTMGVKNIGMSVHNVPASRVLFRPFDFIYDFLLSRCLSWLVVPSKNIVQAMIDERKFPQEIIELSYCGIDDLPLCSLEARANLKNELAVPEDFRILLITGNYEEERKGHEFLFLALSKPLPDFSKFILLIVGHGSEKRKEYLLKRAQELGIDQHIKFLGKRNDIHELNSICDFAVVPSVGVEATPYTIKEAARAGKAVITTDSGGCAEGVSHGLSGYVVPTGDVLALRSRILELLTDDAKCKMMGINSRKMFLERFVLEDKVIQHETLLRRSK